MSDSEGVFARDHDSRMSQAGLLFLAGYWDGGRSSWRTARKTFSCKCTFLWMDSDTTSGIFLAPSQSKSAPRTCSVL